MKLSAPPEPRSIAAACATVDLDIEGMHCAACVTRIEKFLKRVDGVSDASVNLATNRARVSYDPGRAAPAALIGAVERAGYQAQPRHDSPAGAAAAPPARDLIGAALLGTPVLVVGMLWQPRPVAAEWLLCAASAVVILYFGRSFIAGAWQALKSGGGATMDTLIALGSLAAWLYSFAELVAARRPQTYFETGSTIVTLILMGRYLEGRARSRAGDAVRALANLAPKTALVVRGDGEAVETDVGRIQVGDVIRIRPGEKAPVDGVVVSGSSALDESLLTGESVPVVKEQGAIVVGGSLNTTGSLDVRATAVGAHAVLATIVRLVENAQASKPPVQRLADRISAIFVPIVLAVSASTFVIWLALRAPAGIALQDAVAVLVIACPCALGLATPTAIIVGVGRAASLGMLVRDAQALESAGRVSMVIFDKTGTLTEGRFEVTDIVPASGMDPRRLLAIAAAAEQGSEHPIAKGILARAVDEGLSAPAPARFRSVTGGGVCAEVDGVEVLAGSADFLEQRGMAAPATESSAETLVHVAEAGRYAGSIALKDRIRDSSAGAIDALSRLGIASALVSGDVEAVASDVAARVGIGTVMAQVKPDGKVEAVHQLRREAAGPVAMVGDGVNDAAALAAADVGIAMGAAADAASEAAGITLLRADLAGVARAVVLSRRVVAVIRQNLFWAFAFNAIGIPLAAAGRLSPMIAAFAMAFSSVAVVSNSLRLKNA